jgi:hypothetical protein
MSDNERRNIGYGPEDEEADEQETAADSSSMTEGIGGMADVEPEARATVSDVDGDNVPEEDQPLPQ